MTSPPGAEKLPKLIEIFGYLGTPGVGLPIVAAIFGYGAWRAWQRPTTEPTGVRALRAVDGGLAKVEEIALAFLLIALIFLATYQAYKRNYAPPAPFYTDELIRYSVFGIGLLGAALATHSERLINVDMITRVLSTRGKLIAKLVTAAFTIYMCWWFVRGGMHVRKINIQLHEEGEVIAPATAILALPIGTALIGIHLTLHAVIDAYYLATGKTPPKTEAAPI
jgi:TRAP-type C4-dicarboxylate transport system permease small subunit